MPASLESQQKVQREIAAAIGETFGDLTVVRATCRSDSTRSPGEPVNVWLKRIRTKGRALVDVRCSCGHERTARWGAVKRGNLFTCGTQQHRRSANAARYGTYAIEAIGTGMIKIGKAHDVEARLRKLQYVSPSELRVVAVCQDNIEATTHEALRAHRSHGEWFRADPAVLALIADRMEPVTLSVMHEIRARNGQVRPKSRCKCKCCGEIGHMAKTCAKRFTPPATASPSPAAPSGS